MDEPVTLAQDAAERLSTLTGVPRHDAVVVLGSGWGPAADAFGGPRRAFAMTELPGFLAPVAEGHRGTVASYDVGGVPTLVLFGRTHLYEGHGLGPVVHGVRTAAAAGCRTAVLTNANGSLRPDWEVGQSVLVRDHLNLTATSPLRGPALRRPHRLLVGPAARDRARARPDAGRGGRTPGCPDPHYETWAEAEWVRRIGARRARDVDGARGDRGARMRGRGASGSRR